VLDGRTEDRRRRQRAGERAPSPAPDAQADTFAADAWAGAKAFFDALEGLPGPITRDALLAKLRTFTSYDAAGFFGAINLAKKVSNNCFIAMQVVNGKWKRLAPDKGFLC